MEYWHVNWLHDFPDEPVTIYSAIGDDGYETRKVHVYRDGRTVRADEQHESAEIGLSEIPVGDIAEVERQPEFQASVVTRAVFEDAWKAAPWPPRDS
ncbi:hypothetical protein SUDANB120_06142 [Streptomyces sp. enrichment culture]|uniref:DUF6881 domain-containing protein n=1 Tax=Streptomyces sp. enrichment culture TaxID=1795815 RepID=UPI003F578FB9